MSIDLKLIIFTDLNDTLLDRNYDFSAARPALEKIWEYEIPLIITTSKTRAQAEIYRSRLNITHPLIVENGAAVYFPLGSFPTGRLPAGSINVDDEFVFELSRKVDFLVPQLKSAAEETGAEIEMIFDMPTEKIMDLTGMSEAESELARKRSYIIYFRCYSRREELITELQSRGLKVTWGTYFMHLGSNNDKGLAVHKLTALYRSLGHIDLITAGFGDNMNDISMLKNVSKPFLVQHPDGTYEPEMDFDGLVKLNGVGPKGWNDGVLDLIESIDWEIEID